MRKHKRHRDYCPVPNGRNGCEIRDMYNSKHINNLDGKIKQNDSRRRLR